MILIAILPKDRQTEGRLAMIDARSHGEWLRSPVMRCRGEADNAGATRANNVGEDPTMPFGDHPYGVYVVTVAESVPVAQRATYGPYNLRLDPIYGEAATAEANKRTGLLIHGGTLHPDGRLRETYGCLRVDNATIETLAELVMAELAASRSVVYVCEPAREESS